MFRVVSGRDFPPVHDVMGNFHDGLPVPLRKYGDRADQAAVGPANLLPRFWYGADANRCAQVLAASFLKGAECAQDGGVIDGRQQRPFCRGVSQVPADGILCGLEVPSGVQMNGASSAGQGFANRPLGSCETQAGKGTGGSFFEQYDLVHFPVPERRGGAHESVPNQLADAEIVDAEKSRAGVWNVNGDQWDACLGKPRPDAGRESLVGLEFDSQIHPVRDERFGVPNGGTGAVMVVEFDQIELVLRSRRTDAPGNGVGKRGIGCLSGVTDPKNPLVPDREIGPVPVPVHTPEEPRSFEGVENPKSDRLLDSRHFCYFGKSPIIDCFD